MIISNKTFCPLPFIHIHSLPLGEGFLCCTAGCEKKENQVADFTKESLKDSMNNERMKQIRLDMIAGKEIPSCQSCYESEKLYNTSSRTQWLRAYNQDAIDSFIENMNEDGSLKDPSMKFIDLRFSNSCNLECKMCGSGLSSKIMEKEIKIYNRKDIQSSSLYSGKGVVSFLNVNPSILQEVKDQIQPGNSYYFAGGEPLIQEPHLELVKEFGKKNIYDVELMYSTNLSTLKYKGTNFIDEWIKFKKVKVFCSIDDIGERLEYVRVGSDWKKIKKNLKQLIKLKETHKNIVNFKITQVVSIFNIYYLPEFFDELLLLGADSQAIFWNAIHLIGNKWMHPSCLPRYMKQEVEDKLNAFLATVPSRFSERMSKHIATKIREIIIDMNKENLSPSLFIDNVDADYKEVFPWLSKIED
jgi:MoaA/NifB/PqqE/SkfB family radical SAM enzyme